MRTVALAVFALAFLTGSALARADDYLGADAVLKQVDAARGSDQKASPARQLRLDLKSYREHAASLPPEQAARDWLALFDRAVKLPELSDTYSSSNPAPLRLQPVLAALPPPADWDALAAQVAARPPSAKGGAGRTTLVLRTLAGMLQGNHNAVRQAIDALKHPGDEEENADGSVWAVDELQTAFLKLTDNKQDALADFEAKLALLKPDDTGASGNDASREMLRMSGLEVPNLVALAGAPRAEALLRQLFALELQVVAFQDEKTKAVARKVAEEMGSQLKFAPWDLVDTPDAMALYEALDKRFPETWNDGRHQQAAAYYLLGLITRGRTDEAVALALKINQLSSMNGGGGGVLSGVSEETFSDLAGKGYAKEVYRFFDRLLTAHPALSYWRGFITAATLASETDAALAKIKAAGERPDLKPNVKRTLRQAYGDALLAADHVAEALPILRELAANESTVDENGVVGGGRGEAVNEMCTLADIGRLLGDEALVNEQLDAIVKAVKAHPEVLDRVYFHAGDNPNEFFLAAKRGPERERLLVAGLLQARQAAEAAAENQEEPLNPEQAENNARATRLKLFELVDLYFRAERYQDIVTLLDRARDWGAPDVAKLLVTNDGYGGGLNFWPQVARALQKTGHADAALRTINAFLDRNGGVDPAYALLLELLPPDQAEARLNELFQGDQFEERPLIWRAVLQLGQGRLDEAEKSARQAIGIDPSDGEEGRGDRMRAYAVLGDILERKGEPDKAEQMRQAVRAIRLSEDADRFYATGLLTRAVAMYEKALGYFADAYCIQSRLAIQLTALGKLDEAAAHYQRAYELMPESFGRMESHCFGCERAFKGERAQATAERVFQRLAASQPTNPRVHYLFGYLRGEQERNAEAAHEYREAVRLDPDYINAWKQLAAVTDDPADRDRAELNLLRLDPRQNHNGADFSVVGDLRALWLAVEAADKFALPEPASLYPLAASKAALEQERQRHPSKPVETEESLDQEHKPLKPPAAVLKNDVIIKALQLLRGNGETQSTVTE